MAAKNARLIFALLAKGERLRQDPAAELAAATA
jgi:hypothetical protein